MNIIIAFAAGMLVLYLFKQQSAGVPLRFMSTTGNTNGNPTVTGLHTTGYQASSGNSGYDPGINYTGLGQSVGSSGLGVAGALGAGSAVPIAGAALAGVAAIFSAIQQHHQQAVQKEAQLSNQAVKWFYDHITLAFNAAKQAQIEVGVYYSDLGGTSDHSFSGIGGDGMDYHWPDPTWSQIFSTIDQAYADFQQIVQPIRKDGNGPDVVDRTWIKPAHDDFVFVVQKMSHGVHGDTRQSGGYLPAIPDHAGFLGAQRVDFTY